MFRHKTSELSPTDLDKNSTSAAKVEWNINSASPWLNAGSIRKFIAIENAQPMNHWKFEILISRLFPQVNTSDIENANTSAQPNDHPFKVTDLNKSFSEVIEMVSRTWTSIIISQFCIIMWNSFGDENLQNDVALELLRNCCSFLVLQLFSGGVKGDEMRIQLRNVFFTIKHVRRLLRQLLSSPFRDGHTMMMTRRPSIISLSEFVDGRFSTSVYDGKKQFFALIDDFIVRHSLQMWRRKAIKIELRWRVWLKWLEIDYSANNDAISTKYLTRCWCLFSVNHSKISNSLWRRSDRSFLDLVQK